LHWPMIVLRTPKGRTGPSSVDGVPVEGTLRSHRVQIAVSRTDTARLAEMETWLRGYGPAGLFDSAGRPWSTDRRELPRGDRRDGLERSDRGAGRVPADADRPQSARLLAVLTR